MYKPISLPYDYSDLEPFIDAETMDIHYNKHYKTYLDNLNNEFEKNNYQLLPIKKLINDIDDYSQTIRNNAGGFYNHSIFWLMLKNPNKKDNYLPFGISKTIIDRDFENYNKFKSIITEKAKKRFGSGWVWWVLYENGYTNIVETPYQDNPQMHYNCEILLGIDVWEHAYYLKYQSDRTKYVENLMNVVNWDYCNTILNRYY